MHIHIKFNKIALFCNVKIGNNWLETDKKIAYLYMISNTGFFLDIFIFTIKIEYERFFLEFSLQF